MILRECERRPGVAERIHAHGDRAAGRDQGDDDVLTPRELELQREVRALRERSKQLIEEASRRTRPQELLHRFPPSGNDE